MLKFFFFANNAFMKGFFSHCTLVYSRVFSQSVSLLSSTYKNIDERTHHFKKSPFMMSFMTSLNSKNLLKVFLFNIFIRLIAHLVFIADALNNIMLVLSLWALLSLFSGLYFFHSLRFHAALYKSVIIDPPNFQPKVK